MILISANNDFLHDGTTICFDLQLNMQDVDILVIFTKIRYVAISYTELIHLFDTYKTTIYLNFVIFCCCCGLHSVATFILITLA